MIEAAVHKTFASGHDSAGFTLNAAFQAREGITVLFGPSGAGKTLILDCIAGFLRPDAGLIRLDGKILFDSDAKVWVRPQDRRCGYVFQNYALFPNMTVRENLLFAATTRKDLNAAQAVNDALSRFRLTEVAGRRPHQISGGQKQRCSIARALVGGPRILLLDEPARGLDAPLRAELYDLLREVRNEIATPVLLVTHSLWEAFELADEMIAVREGAVVQAGTPASICGRPADLELARLLGIFNILPVEIESLDPLHGTSILRFGEHLIRTEHLPGRRPGDRVHLLASPRQLRARRTQGPPGPNQIPMQLERAVEMPDGVRLEFPGGLHVHADQGATIHNGSWVVEFPAQGLQVL